MSGPNVQYPPIIAPNAVTTSSSTPMTVAVGIQVPIVPTGLSISDGQQVIISNSANIMYGTVNSYIGGSLSVTISSVIGSGTFNSWLVVVYDGLVTFSAPIVIVLIVDPRDLYNGYPSNSFPIQYNLTGVVGGPGTQWYDDGPPWNGSGPFTLSATTTVSARVVGESSVNPWAGPIVNTQFIINVATTNYHMYITQSTDRQVIKRLNSNSVPAVYDNIYFGDYDQIGKMKHPSSVTTNGHFIYACDYNNNRVIKFDKYLNKVTTYPDTNKQQTSIVTINPVDNILTIAPSYFNRTSSMTPLTVQSGSMSLNIDVDLDLSNSTSIVLSNGNNTMTGTIASYTAQNGSLDVIINTFTGSGTYSYWSIIIYSSGSQHAYAKAEPVRLNVGNVATDKLPSPLSPDVTYYAIVVSSTQIKLALTQADALTNSPIDIIGDGVGTFECTCAILSYKPYLIYYDDIMMNLYVLGVVPNLWNIKIERLSINFNSIKVSSFLGNMSNGLMPTGFCRGYHTTSSIVDEFLVCGQGDDIFKTIESTNDFSPFTSQTISGVAPNRYMGMVKHSNGSLYLNDGTKIIRVDPLYTKVGDSNYITKTTYGLKQSYVDDSMLIWARDRKPIDKPRVLRYDSNLNFVSELYKTTGPTIDVNADNVTDFVEIDINL